MVDETKRKKVVAQKRGIRKRATPTVTSQAAETEVPAESVALPLKKPAKKKKAGEASKSRTVVNQAVSPATEAPEIAGPSYEQIRLRAYFISVHRRDLGLPGDETGDWVQAETELREEMALEQV